MKELCEPSINRTQFTFSDNFPSDGLPPTLSFRS